MDECLFCEIVEGKKPSVKILETDGFLVIENKFPVAPIHLLVLSKSHFEKSETISGQHPGFWDSLIDAADKAIEIKGMGASGYKLVSNGSRYAHFQHEHLHILGGSEEEPGGKT